MDLARPSATAPQAGHHSAATRGLSCLLLSAALGLSPGAASADVASTINGDQTVSGSQSVGNGQTITGGQTVTGTQTVNGSQSLNGDQTISGNSEINGGQTIRQWLVIGDPPPLPPEPGNLYINGKAVIPMDPPAIEPSLAPTDTWLTACPNTGASSVCVGASAWTSGDNATARVRCRQRVRRHGHRCHEPGDRRQWGGDRHRLGRR